MAYSDQYQPERFELSIPQGSIDDLRERLSRTRLPDQAPDDPWAYGTDINYLQTLIDYWQDGFDWRAQEAQ